MTAEDGEGETPPPVDPADEETADRASTAEVEELREELREFREDVEERTLHREDVEDDLKRYVRRQVRSGHARDWGPYVVLLYGTIMTLGAFYFLQDQALWAVLAMLVIWLSTLGLYVMMVLVGIGVGVLDVPGRAIDYVRNR